LDEFYKIYEVSELKWKRKHPDTPWYISLGPSFLSKAFAVVHDIVVHKWFEALVYMVITLSAFWQVIEAATFSGFTSTADIEYIESSWITLSFVCFYGMEVALKIVGLGITGYFHSGWNVFDFLVTVLALVGLITEAFGIPFSFIFILRSLRLLKLFELKKRYRDIMGTFIYIMMKRFGSVSVVVLIVYYFFAILGMELFSKYDLIDCCKNTTVEQYFASGSPNSSIKGYYYLNNFEDISTSFVTLFELMVVNNWFILMDGYATVTTELSRLYFMTFYIVTMVVITIVVAFVLEAFLFRIQYKRQMGDIDKDTMIVVDIHLLREEVEFCFSNSYNLSNISQLVRFSEDLQQTQSHHPFEGSPHVTYHGSRTRSKFSFSLKMYAEEVKLRVEAAEAQERDRVQGLIPRNGLRGRRRAQDEEAFDEDGATDGRRTFSCSY
jgi:two pore calcium channel protein 1